MDVESIKKKQNVNVNSSDSTTDEDDTILERELPRYLKNIIHRVFEVPEKDRDRDCGVVPIDDWPIVSQLEELVDSGKGKPKRLRHLISEYYQQTGNVQSALERAKEVYKQEMKDLEAYNQKLRRKDLEDREPKDLEPGYEDYEL